MRVISVFHVSLHDCGANFCVEIGCLLSDVPTANVPEPKPDSCGSCIGKGPNSGTSSQSSFPQPCVQVTSTMAMLTPDTRAVNVQKASAVPPAWFKAIVSPVVVGTSSMHVVDAKSLQMMAAIMSKLSQMLHGKEKMRQLCYSVCWRHI